MLDPESNVVARIIQEHLSEDVGTTLLYAVPASQEGGYRIGAILYLTTIPELPASTVPALTIFWTTGTTVESFELTPTNSANDFTALEQGSMVVYAEAETDIEYSTSGYVSVPSAMEYTIRIWVEAIG